MTMANEINDVLKRAELDMRSHGRLSKGTYFDVYDLAINGEAFVCTMAPHDAYKLRALLQRHNIKGVMRQSIQSNGTMKVSFNL